MPKQTPEKRAAYNREYRAIPENRMKIRARDNLRSALLFRRMVRQPCEVCGAAKTHGHHDDYSNPLEVRWLCHPCHAAEHRGHHRGRGVPRTITPPRTHCAQGHALTGDNIFVSAGRRICRECNRAYQRLQYWRRKKARLELQLEASKGGNVAGITEDHRHEMANELHTIRERLAP